MSPGSATPATRPSRSSPSSEGLVAPDRVIEIDIRSERTLRDSPPAITESRLVELAATIRLR